jgi:predicted dehydrogenase
MESPLKTRILSGLAFAQVEAHETAVRFGHWDKPRDLASAFALVHRDAARALEVITVGDGPSPKLGKEFTRAEEALADVIIRILDIAGGKNLHVPAALVAKLELNEQQSYVIKKDY